LAFKGKTLIADKAPRKSQLKISQGRCDISELDISMLKRANELACLGLGLTGSNPIVGAVVVDSAGKVIGEGFHKSGPHAEIVALEQAGLSAKSATLYVTLEPCNHEGKTGPCTEAIIEAGIAKVVYAVRDPNLLASGGAKVLEEAGIDVVFNSDVAEITNSNRAWLHKIKNHRPYFIWKIATTLDGRTAAIDGSSKWITGTESRAEVSKLRSESHAILIGTATALADNPHLIPRNLETAREANPARIVMGLREIPSGFNLHNDAAETVFLRSHDFSELLTLCNEREFNQVLVESGSELGTALLRAGLIDELVIFQAASLLGSGLSFIGDLGATNIKEKMDFLIRDVAQFGNDLKITLTKETGI
jgi:diaminohydroxyphosphoribosylaminopyrimidine deaminase/5-amino-6-(5-phosphoribosylamino)uracil reductase